MDRLDSAVLQQLDLKIQFDYLRPEQAGKLFIRVLADFQGYTRPRRYAESVNVQLSQLKETMGHCEVAPLQRRVVSGMMTSNFMILSLMEVSMKSGEGQAHENLQGIQAPRFWI
jgi:glycine cleavage system aminomethyltransferase T